jgi:hypothetical protein
MVKKCIFFFSTNLLECRDDGRTRKQKKKFVSYVKKIVRKKNVRKNDVFLTHKYFILKKMGDGAIDDISCTVN